MAGTDKENVIRLICEVSGITREEAEEFVFKPPRDILLGVTKTVAETAKYKLEAAGARVLMRPRLD